MSDINETAIEGNKEFESSGSEWIWSILILMICFGGFGCFENPRIGKLEKKVGRLEGQMSMIGGKKFE